MIIDIHGHLVPPDLLAAIRKDGPWLPSLKIIDNDAGLALAFGNASGGWPDWFGNDLPAADTDTIEHDPRVLRFVIEMMGAERVMFGSDMPFTIGDHEPMTMVTSPGLEPDQVVAISGGTAQQLFRIN